MNKYKVTSFMDHELGKYDDQTYMTPYVTKHIYLIKSTVLKLIISNYNPWSLCFLKMNGTRAKKQWNIHWRTLVLGHPLHHYALSIINAILGERSGTSYRFPWSQNIIPTWICLLWVIQDIWVIQVIWVISPPAWAMTGCGLNLKMIN